MTALDLTELRDSRLTLAACPVCGKEERIFLRQGTELVCRSHFPRHHWGPIPGQDGLRNPGTGGQS